VTVPPAAALRPGAVPARSEPAARRRTRPEDGRLGRAVARARAGDEGAFCDVYRTVQPMLLRYVRGIVGDDADDVASDAWHDIVRDLATFRGDGDAFRAWAATIARHRALDHLRRAGKRPRTTALDAVPTEPAPAPDSAGLALENLSTADALALVAALPPDQAGAVLLRVVMGLSGPAAAAVLGKRPGAVRTAAHRGLRRLAEQLAQPPAPRPAADRPAP
jgi:RNA polymerase sigma-70 factor (ECF subfamily)